MREYPYHTTSLAEASRAVSIRVSRCLPREDSRPNKGNMRGIPEDIGCARGRTESVRDLPFDVSHSLEVEGRVYGRTAVETSSIG